MRNFIKGTVCYIKIVLLKMKRDKRHYYLSYFIKTYIHNVTYIQLLLCVACYTNIVIRAWCSICLALHLYSVTY